MRNVIKSVKWTTSMIRRKRDSCLCPVLGSYGITKLTISKLKILLEDSTINVLSSRGSVLSSECLWRHVSIIRVRHMAHMAYDHHDVCIYGILGRFEGYSFDKVLRNGVYTISHNTMVQQQYLCKCKSTYTVMYAYEQSSLQ